MAIEETVGGCIARFFITPESSQTPLETEHALRAANYANLLFRMVDLKWSWSDKLVNAWAVEKWLCYIGQSCFPNKLVGDPIIGTYANGITSATYRVTESGRAVRVLINSGLSDGNTADDARVQSGNLVLSGVSTSEMIIESQSAIGCMNYMRLYGETIDAITESQKPRGSAAVAPAEGQLPMFDFVLPKR